MFESSCKHEETTEEQLVRLRRELQQINHKISQHNAAVPGRTGGILPPLLKEKMLKSFWI